MKKLFFIGLIGLLLFEIASVYFIMPMPGSQRMNSISLAYFLYGWRWAFRVLFVALMLYGLLTARWKYKIAPVIFLLVAGAIIYFANFKMAADHMFYQPSVVAMSNASQAAIDSQQLVIGVALNGEAKAYPIQYLGYHHQVQDEVGNKPVLVTYCTVCRTGRVYEPTVNGKHELFRLVGMDHFNAMLEDATTKSWWRQATGEAVAGKLKGNKLPEIFSTQTSLATWVRLHPATLVMKPDTVYRAEYDSMRKYETGKGRSELTKRDTASWKDKSWVVGVEAGNATKAYDWNLLSKQKLIEDNLDGSNIIVVLADDDKSFFAFNKPGDAIIRLQHDTIYAGETAYSVDGKGINTSNNLQPLAAYQEFWHSWKTFHPNTAR